jgi:hypothetical protein
MDLATILQSRGVQGLVGAVASEVQDNERLMAELEQLKKLHGAVGSIIQQLTAKAIRQNGNLDPELNSMLKNIEEDPEAAQASKKSIDLTNLTGSQIKELPPEMQKEAKERLTGELGGGIKNVGAAAFKAATQLGTGGTIEGLKEAGSGLLDIFKKIVSDEDFDAEEQVSGVAYVTDDGKVVISNANGDLMQADPELAAQILDTDNDEYVIDNDQELNDVIDGDDVDYDEFIIV